MRYCVKNSNVMVYVVQPITGLIVIYLIEVNMCITLTLAPLNSLLLVECLKFPYWGCCFYYNINDIANVSDILFSILFADDTSVFIHDDQLDDITNTMNIELKKRVAC